MILVMKAMLKNQPVLPANPEVQSDGQHETRINHKREVRDAQKAGQSQQLNLRKRRSA